jgi:mannose-6-phosphate isomerase-like protein (cupin superfamily)
MRLDIDRLPAYLSDMDMLPVELPVDRAGAERVLLGTDEITVLATSAQTAGALFAVQIRMRPGGGPPVMHRHDPGEIYYVLDGEFTFYVEDATGVRRVVAGTGDVVPLAGGTPHTIRNESAADAVAFVVHAPGAPMEGFSRAVAAAAAEGDPSMEAVLSIAAQHGIELLGPIPDLAVARCVDRGCAGSTPP